MEYKGFLLNIYISKTAYMSYGIVISIVFR